MLENLIGKPTTTVLEEIYQNHRNRVQQFYLAGFTLGYEKDKLNHLYSLEVDNLKNPAWFEQVRQNIREPYIGVISRVMRNDGFGLILMADYDKGSALSDQLIFAEMLQALNFPNGVIARSGNGFHYISINVLEEWIFMDALNVLKKFKPSSTIDRKWIEMCKRNGFFELRLTSGVAKPNIPTIVAVHRLKCPELGETE